MSKKEQEELREWESLLEKLDLDEEEVEPKQSLLERLVYVIFTVLFVCFIFHVTLSRWFTWWSVWDSISLYMLIRAIYITWGE